MKYIIVLILGASLFFACRFIGGKRVRGDGNLTTQQRTVSDFDGIESYGSFEISLVPGNERSVKVDAEDNLQPYIETIVEGNRLKINTKRGFNLRPTVDIKITVTTPSCSVVESFGSGNISSLSGFT